MYELLRTQTILVDSARRRGNDASYCYTVTFDSDTPRCREDEVFKLTLKSFAAPFNWGNVTDANRAFTITEDGTPVPIQIQRGSYTFKALANAVTSAYFAALGVAGADYDRFRCSWSAVTNRLTFASASRTLGLAFPTLAAARAYGFDATAPPGLTSTRPLDPMRYASLCITVAGVHPLTTGYNLANLFSELVVRTNMFAVVPIDASSVPWTMVRYANHDDAFATFLLDKSIDTLQVQVTDLDGNPVLDLSDHHIVFQLDTYRSVDRSHETLRSIDGSLRTQVLALAAGRR
jgi:hypothetical protein